MRALAAGARAWSMSQQQEGEESGRALEHTQCKAQGPVPS